ncbi:hypothetical protein T439DRAFT_225580 [Meredithblackwellia eburnea MCA 4105]
MPLKPGITVRSSKALFNPSGNRIQVDGCAPPLPDQAPIPDVPLLPPQYRLPVSEASPKLPEFVKVDAGDWGPLLQPHSEVQSKRVSQATPPPSSSDGRKRQGSVYLTDLDKPLPAIERVPQRKNKNNFFSPRQSVARLSSPSNIRRNPSTAIVTNPKSVSAQGRRPPTPTPKFNKFSTSNTSLGSLEGYPEDIKDVYFGEAQRGVSVSPAKPFQMKGRRHPTPSQQQTSL